MPNLTPGEEKVCCQFSIIPPLLVSEKRGGFIFGRGKKDLRDNDTCGGS